MSLRPLLCAALNMRRATRLGLAAVELILRIPGLRRKAPIILLMLRLSAVENSTRRVLGETRLSSCPIGGRKFTLVTLLVLLTIMILMDESASVRRCSRLLRWFG